MNIDRRDALAGIVAMFGASLFAPIARAATGDVTPISTGAPSAAVFTPPQRALMTALSERIMPTTDTPGAIAAGVPEFIEKLLADWALPADRVPIIAGLDAIEARSRADYSVAGAEAMQMPVDPDIRRALEHEHELLLHALGVRIRGAPAGQEALVMDAEPGEAERARQRCADAQVLIAVRVMPGVGTFKRGPVADEIGA